MEIDKEKLKDAWQKAENTKKKSFGDVSEEERKRMEERLREANIGEKLKKLWDDLVNGKTPPDKVLYELVNIILGQ